MKIFFDLFPVILFFITLKIAEKAASASQVLADILTTLGISAAVKPSLVPIMLATCAVIVGSIIQIIWAKLHYKKVDNTLWISADRKSTRLNSSHVALSRMPPSA